jgi:hypothetical protein
MGPLFLYFVFTTGNQNFPVSEIDNTDRKIRKLISLPEYRQENTDRDKATGKYNFPVGQPISLLVHHFLKKEPSQH